MQLGGLCMFLCSYNGFIQHDIVFKLTHAMIMLHISVMNNIIMLCRGGQAAGVLIVRLFNNNMVS